MRLALVTFLATLYTPGAGQYTDRIDKLDDQTVDLMAVLVVSGKLSKGGVVGYLISTGWFAQVEA